ncbi:MAG TPA: hypothetical protein ENJ00_03430 [Phycisphaerales bacterium]|nr:hypothetical protein [Phycisphaerales bacterium]
MTQGSDQTTACWLRADQTELIRSIAESAGLRIIEAGSPDGPHPAERLAAKPVNDFRTLLATTEADVVLLADASGSVRADEQRELASILDAADRGIQILSFEPFPATPLLLDLPIWREHTDTTRNRLHFIPLARSSPAFFDAQELLEQFGPVEAIAIRSLDDRSAGSLGARLFGSCEMLISLFGVPQSIDAAHAGITPESLRGLTGHLSANARFRDGRIASIFVSDSAAAWSRSISLIGKSGRIEANDHALRWLKPDRTGLTEDQPAEPGHSHDPAISIIAEAIRAALNPSIRIAPIDMPTTLAVAHAAVLSARTGQPESPTTILAMLGYS